MTCNENTWIVLMAEGTRYTPEKYQNGIKFAKERNIEPLKHHLVPRAKGFALSLPLLKKYKCPVVYNVQLSFDMNAENPPHMASLIMGKKLVAHVYIDRIPIENVEPTFESLYDIFKEKDALQDSFVKHGNYYEGRGLSAVEGHKMNRSILVLINAICWLLFEVFLILYGAKRMIDAEKVQQLTLICISVVGVCELNNLAIKLCALVI
jgi:lysophosphatidic acid acyltransferase/lysophosphatidylinositol acyltransferase